MPRKITQRFWPILMFITCWHGVPASAQVPSTPQPFGIVFSYDEYTQILASHVNEAGLVDYKGLIPDREKLDNFVRDVAGLYVEMYDAWPEDEKLAFWINTYNALTLRAVVDHYPVKSIKDVGSRLNSVWDKLEFMVKGNMMTLNDIEHKILRTQFNEPRIHMAINCAARSCPPLRRAPYLAETLNEQLDDQTKRFLANPKNFRIDAKSKKVHLSSIFKWFGEDFEKKYGEQSFADWGSKTEKAVLYFISQYLSEEDKQTLRANAYSIKYLDYDWKLNKQ